MQTQLLISAYSCKFVAELLLKIHDSTISK